LPSLIRFRNQCLFLVDPSRPMRLPCSRPSTPGLLPRGASARLSRRILPIVAFAPPPGCTTSPETGDHTSGFFCPLFPFFPYRERPPLFCSSWLRYQIESPTQIRLLQASAVMSCLVITFFTFFPLPPPLLIFLIDQTVTPGSEICFARLPQVQVARLNSDSAFFFGIGFT